MKKIMLIAALVFAATTTNAQSIGSILKNAASNVASQTLTGNGSTASTVLGSVFNNLLGTSTVKESNLVGTWVYNQPSLVFESSQSNILANLGGELAGKAAAKRMNKVLVKTGFKAGKVILTLNSDHTGTITISGRSIGCTWAVSGCTLTLSGNVTGLLNAPMNVSICGNEMQLAANADRVMGLVGSVGTVASKLNSNFGKITKILKNYDGAQIGLQFVRQ